MPETKKSLPAKLARHLAVLGAVAELAHPSAAKAQELPDFNGPALVERIVQGGAHDVPAMERALRQAYAEQVPRARRSLEEETAFVEAGVRERLFGDLRRLDFVGYVDGLAQRIAEKNGKAEGPEILERAYEAESAEAEDAVERNADAAGISFLLAKDMMADARKRLERPLDATDRARRAKVRARLYDQALRHLSLDPNAREYARGMAAEYARQFGALRAGQDFGFRMEPVVIAFETKAGDAKKEETALLNWLQKGAVFSDALRARAGEVEAGLKQASPAEARRTIRELLDAAERESARASLLLMVQRLPGVETLVPAAVLPAWTQLRESMERYEREGVPKPEGFFFIPKVNLQAPLSGPGDRGAVADLSGARGATQQMDNQVSAFLGWKNLPAYDEYHRKQQAFQRLEDVMDRTVPAVADAILESIAAFLEDTQSD